MLNKHYIPIAISNNNGKNISLVIVKILQIL